MWSETLFGQQWGAMASSWVGEVGARMLPSDVGGAWETGKPQRKALFILFQACSQALGESEHHGDHLQHSWVYGAGEGVGGFPGSSIGRHPPGAWEASAQGLGGSWHLATLRLVGRGAGWWCRGGGADRCSWFLGAVSASHCPRGVPGWLVDSQAIRELGS